MLQYKIKSSSQDFVTYATRLTRLKSINFKILFWGLTLFSLFFGFFSALMGTTKLASSRFPENYKFFVNLFVQDGVDQWPIFVLWIGVATSILSGLLALFVVRKRWISNSKIYNLITLEKRVYQSNSGIYSDSQTKDFILFDRVSQILKINSKLQERWAQNEK